MEEKQINNCVALMGVISSEMVDIDNIYGMEYAGWATTVETVRRSGVPDEAVVIMPYDTYVEDLEIGAPVMAIGQIQTFKDHNTGKVLVYVLIPEGGYIETIHGDHWQEQNELQLRGTIGRGTVYRETPKGKRITDIKLIVPNQLRQSNCYIPCICWNEQADEVKDWAEGTEVVISGRLQSREYTKRINEDTQEQRTCYEVSVNNIKKAEA